MSSLTKTNGDDNSLSPTSSNGKNHNGVVNENGMPSPNDIDYNQGSGSPPSPHDPDDDAELNTAQNELLHAQNMQNNDVIFTILKHTCLVCSKSFEEAKWLRRHFLLEHIVARPTYTCSLCTTTTMYELDGYFAHLLTRHDMTGPHLGHLYDIFVVKYIQDVLADFFVHGEFYLNTQHIKHINRLKYGKEVMTMVDRLRQKIFENFFINASDTQAACSSNVHLSARSLKSNLIYTPVTRTKIFREIYDYCAPLDAASLSSEAREAIALSARIENGEAQVTQTKHNQCKFCLKLFNESNEYKMHLMEVHAYSDVCNKCLVCPYCRMLLKANHLKANMLKMLNRHVKRGECSSLQINAMPAINMFGVNDEKWDEIEQTNCDKPKSVEPLEEGEVYMNGHNGLSSDCNIVKKLHLNNNTINSNDSEMEDDDAFASEAESTADPSPTTCPLCDDFSVDTSSTDAVLLKREHLNEHHLAETCPLCEGDELIMASNVHAHLAAKHRTTKGDLYECTACQMKGPGPIRHRTFQQSWSLVDHYNELHRSAKYVRSWKCLKCMQCIPADYKSLQHHSLTQCSPAVKLEAQVATSTMTDAAVAQQLLELHCKQEA